MLRGMDKLSEGFEMALGGRWGVAGGGGAQTLWQLFQTALHPFWKEVYYKRKEFAPLPFLVDPFTEGPCWAGTQTEHQSGIQPF